MRASMYFVNYKPKLKNENAILNILNISLNLNILVYNDKFILCRKFRWAMFCWKNVIGLPP